MVQRRNLFQDSNFPKSYLPPIRGSSWHKNKIKMTRRGHYSSNNFQDSTKIKITEKKTLGYLPRVLFFNAFELGIKSENQVFSSEGALSSSDALCLSLTFTLTFREFMTIAWWRGEFYSDFSHIYHRAQEF
jgi:hypothetical protein